MGDWVYYITFMPMREIATRISVAEDIHTADTLKELLQRQLTNRSGEIETYLRTQPQRFFNALVVGTYGGKPQWHELSIRKIESHLKNAPEYLDGALGVLTLQGNETLFAIDGQHRVSGIEKAIEKTPKLGDEEVTVIFVAGIIAKKREEDPEGFERTRRLFTTLNRYAKPVSKRDIIALDEDDVIAITTRRLVEETPLFRNKVSVAKNKSLPVTDRKNLTTIVTIYDALDIYLRTTQKGWGKFKRKRPDSEDEVKSFFDRSTALFDSMCKSFPPLAKLRDSEPDDEVASRHRSVKGGHLLFRPIGFQMVVQTISLLLQQDIPLAKAIAAVSKVPMQLAKPPWLGLMWDDTNHRMITRDTPKPAQRLLYYCAGGDLATFNTDEQTLRSDLAGVMNMRPADVTLKRYA
jgi:DNA sulfur modification protein DndB